MGIKGTASEITEKWQRKMKGSTEDMRRGVDRMTKNPMEEAVKAQGKMLANLVEAINSGRWAAGLEKITLEDWKKQYKEKGLARVSAGVDGAKDKQMDFYSWLIPQLESTAREVDAMPSVTFEDRIARADKQMRSMHEKRYKK